MANELELLKQQYLQKLLTPTPTLGKPKKIGDIEKISSATQGLGDLVKFVEKPTEGKEWWENLQTGLQTVSDPLKQAYEQKLEYERTPEGLMERVSASQDPIEQYYMMKDVEKAKQSRGAQEKSLQEQELARQKAIADYLAQQQGFETELEKSRIGASPDLLKAGIDIAKVAKVRPQDVPQFIEQIKYGKTPELQKKGVPFFKEVAMVPRGTKAKIEKYKNVPLDMPLDKAAAGIPKKRP